MPRPENGRMFSWRKWSIHGNSNNDEADEGKYKCRVSNGPSTYLSKDGEVVYLAPSIQKQPRSLSLKEGAKARFEATISGKPDPVYQWQKLG